MSTRYWPNRQSSAGAGRLAAQVGEKPVDHGLRSGGRSRCPTRRDGTMTPRILMLCVSARAKNVVVLDIHSHISRIGGIAKPIANLIIVAGYGNALVERPVTRPTKLVISVFSGTIGSIANISRPTRIALYDNLSSTSKQGHNQDRRPQHSRLHPDVSLSAIEESALATYG